MSGPLPIELILKPMYSSNEVSSYTLCYCAAAPFERYLHQLKVLPLDKLINQQEGILAYKVINGTYLLNDFLNHGDVRHQIQIIIIICHDFLPTPKRGSHVKSGKTHTQSS